MIRVPVNKLQEGQVLAQEVTRQDGVVLMSAGKVINGEIKSLLLRLEVDSVVVEGDLFGSEEERQDYLSRQREALYQRFSRVEHDPVLMGIRELFRRRLASGCAPPLPPVPSPALDGQAAPPAASKTVAPKAPPAAKGPAKIIGPKKAGR